jgi:hypothetical protein
MADWSLDDTVLEAYIERFYGHGRYGAEYWFVGMEFGGGGSENEIVSRIQGWQARGGKELEDLGGPPWFRPPFPLQSTWAKLIRVLLSAEGSPPTKEEVRAYQKDELGRVGGRDCIVELLPLPSPGLNQWRFYPEHSQLPYLRDRATYTSHIGPGRAAHLRARIEKHGPPAVIFYGAGYAHWWREIAGIDFQSADVGKVRVARNGPTLFVVMQHPTARGLGNAYFDAVGQLIAQMRG